MAPAVPPTVRRLVERRCVERRCVERRAALRAVPSAYQIPGQRECRAANGDPVHAHFPPLKHTPCNHLEEVQNNSPSPCTCGIPNANSPRSAAARRTNRYRAVTADSGDRSRAISNHLSDWSLIPSHRQRKNSP